MLKRLLHYALCSVRYVSRRAASTIAGQATMTLLQILPPLVYAAAGAAIFAVASGRSLSGAGAWLAPAVIAAAFAAFTAVTVLREGVVGFWRNHTVNFSGNQVWFDLVIAVGLCFVLIAPRARAVGMKTMPWGIAVVLTACIGLLPMYARLLWLEYRHAAKE